MVNKKNYYTDKKDHNLPTNISVAHSDVGPMIHSVTGTVVPVYHSRVDEISCEGKLAQAHKNPPTQKLFHWPFNFNFLQFSLALKHAKQLFSTH